jgi:DNA-binding MarR family transcriptional regulator
MSKQPRENPRPIFAGLPEGSFSGGFPVRRDESSEIFGLFLSAMEAGAAAMRTGLCLDPAVEFPAKLVRALLYLLQHRSTAVAVGDLAEGLRVSLGWASRVADELALMGFVNRVRGERDRRVVHLELTEKAIKVAERLWSDHEAAIAAALGDLLPNERATVARFLRRLRTELDAPSKG